MIVIMTSAEIRKRFLEFFQKRGHTVIPSASLVPENDPSVLFNTAGMQPLMPYLLGKEHPAGKRLVNSQKCVRTQDIDEVGDNTHDTFFEMLGNWSLGDYFKEDAIKWSYEFLTSPEEGLGLDPKHLYITVFGGSDKVEKDLQSVEIWKSLGIPEHRIYFKSSKSNWWSVGLNSPAGPSTEMFYDLSGTLGDMDQKAFEVAEESQQVAEIWNDVFMMYFQENGEVVRELPKRNVDTGAGLERVTMAVQGKDNIFDTDLFSDVMNIIKSNSQNYDEKSARIIADHIRTSVFIIADGVAPSNKDRGYILRRLIRRAVLKMKKIMFDAALSGTEIIQMFVEKYSSNYPNLDGEAIRTVFKEEESKFLKTLESGMKEFEKATDPFVLFTSYGFPFELTKELAQEKGIFLDEKDFQEKLTKHQEQSRAGAAQKFNPK